MHICYCCRPWPETKIKIVPSVTYCEILLLLLLPTLYLILVFWSTCVEFSYTKIWALLFLEDARHRNRQWGRGRRLFGWWHPQHEQTENYADVGANCGRYVKLEYLLINVASAKSAAGAQVPCDECSYTSTGSFVIFYATHSLFCSLLLNCTLHEAYVDWGLLLSIHPPFYPKAAISKGATPSQVFKNK